MVGGGVWLGGEEKQKGKGKGGKKGVYKHEETLMRLEGEEREELMWKGVKY